MLDASASIVAEAGPPFEANLLGRHAVIANRLDDRIRVDGEIVAIWRDGPMVKITVAGSTGSWSMELSDKTFYKLILKPIV